MAEREGGTEYGARGAFFGLLRVVPRVQAVAKRVHSALAKVATTHAGFVGSCGMSPGVDLFRLGWRWLEGEVIEMVRSASVYMA